MTNKEKENLLYKIELAENTINHINYELKSVIPYEMITKRIKIIIDNYKKYGQQKKTKTK